MALSNWDTLCVSLDGTPSDGTVQSRLGVSVSFYKNWLYVRDPVAWQEGGRFVHPTVMMIDRGALEYKDVTIYAERGPQEGVYAAVTTGTTGMVGCGVYGFGVPANAHQNRVSSREPVWLGVTADTIKWFSRRVRGGRWHWPEGFKVEWLEQARSLNQGDAYIAQHAGMTAFSTFIAFATAPGARRAPLMLSIIDGAFKKKGGE